MEAKRLKEPCPVFQAIVSIKIKNDGHYFPGTGACCTDGLNETLTDPRPGIPHEIVEARFTAKREALRKCMGNK
ncbi:hypothetical protein CYD30_26785 [Kosakonia cowanii]|nr:hypothetical protein CYD30_26785 [Kosakonia cowanii]